MALYKRHHLRLTAFLGDSFRSLVVAVVAAEGCSSVARVRSCTAVDFGAAVVGVPLGCKSQLLVRM